MIGSGETHGKSAKKDGNQNKKKALEMLKHNTDTLNASSQIFHEITDYKRNDSGDDIFEVPATHSPPRKKRSSNVFASTESINNYDLLDETPFPVLKNKALQKIKNDTRKSLNVSMLSSPSIMSSKPQRTNETLVEAGSSKEKDQKRQSVNYVDNTFDKLKNSEYTSDTVKINDNEYHNPPTVKDNKADEQQINANSKPDLPVLSPVKKFESKTDWGGINCDALRHLKENTSNFRLILDELKKAK